MCNAADCNHTHATSIQTDEDVQLLLKSYSAATHNGTLTIYNPKTKGNVTIRIKTQSKKAKFAPGQRIIQRLVGTNRSDYRAWRTFGFVSEEWGVAVFKKMRGDGKTKSEWEALAWLASNPLQGMMSKGLEYHLEGQCRICNRALTVRDSIITGVGPVCAKRANETTTFSAVNAAA